MEISELTLKIILLLIPGAIASLIVEQLTIHKNWSPFRFMISSTVLGCITYLLLQLIYWMPCLKITNKDLQFWMALTDSKTIPYHEILFASLISLIIGLVVSFAIQKKWIFKISRKLSVSDKYGDECLYYYYLNSKDLTEVYVRDFKQNLTFHGFVQAFSESDLERELVLIDVDVYKLTNSKYLYNSPAIFISRPKNYNWQIDLPDLDQKNKKDEEK